MKYGKWVIKRQQLEEDNLYLTTIPIAGWVLSLWMYSFYLPLEYLIRPQIVQKESK